MDTELVRSVVRGLRYRPLGHLVGRSVQVPDLDAVEEAVRLALGADLPDACRLAAPDLPSRRRSVARYGVLDLRFTAPVEMLTGDARAGVPLLRDLGFLPGGDAGPQHRVCDDPTCLEMLQDALAEGQTWLLLLLEGRRPDAADGHAVEDVPGGDLPWTFWVTDACVSNAGNAWLWRHFYP